MNWKSLWQRYWQQKSPSLDVMGLMDSQQESKRLLVLAVSSAGFILSTAHLILSQLITKQSMHSAEAEAELRPWANQAAMLRDLDKRSTSLQNIKQQARVYQANTSQLFSSLVTMAGSSVCFASVVRHRNKVILTGYSVTTNELMRVAKLLRESGIFSQLSVDHVRLEKNNQAIGFVMQAVEKSRLPSSEQAFDGDDE